MAWDFPKPPFLYRGAQGYRTLGVARSSRELKGPPVGHADRSLRTTRLYNSVTEEGSSSPSRTEEGTSDLFATSILLVSTLFFSTRSFHGARKGLPRG